MARIGMEGSRSRRGFYRISGAPHGNAAILRAARDSARIAIPWDGCLRFDGKRGKWVEGWRSVAPL